MPDDAIGADELAVLLDLNQRLLEADDKDVEFVLRDGKVYAHKTILRAVSDVWAGMFASGMKEQAGVIEMKDISCREMRVFLRALYTGQLNPIDWLTKLSDILESTKEHKEEEVLSNELEKHVPYGSRSRHTHKIVFQHYPPMPYTMSDHGERCITLSPQDGMQHFVAETCASVGVKRGRYLYEVTIRESTVCSHDSSHHVSKLLVRVGFSTGECEECVVTYFQSDGVFVSPGSHEKRATTPFVKHDIIGVLLNLDSDTPNMNTMSLFFNGKRASQPQPLPEILKGKTLFPFVAFCNASLDVRFGPEPQKPLPFTCLMLGAAPSSDVACAKTMQPKVPLDFLLTVMTLAKRHMVRSVMSMALQALKNRMHNAVSNGDVDTFETIFSSAISSDVGALRMACLDGAKVFGALKTRYDAHSLRPEVQFELEAIWSTAWAPVKRLRFA